MPTPTGPRYARGPRGKLGNLWLRTFPNAEVTRLDDAGHFLQEDAHERIMPELLRFLAQHADRTAVDRSRLER
jgi:pimeloyl-ACP methyl ester carboxylesterase